MTGNKIKFIDTSDAKLYEEVLKIVKSKPVRAIFIFENGDKETNYIWMGDGDFDKIMNIMAEVDRRLLADVIEQEMCSDNSGPEDTWK